MISTKEIKDIIKKGKIIFGTKQTMQAAKQGTLKQVFVCSNCKQETLEDLEKYAGMSKFKFVQLEITNRDLGTIAKKPFSVSLIGVLK